MPTSMQLATTVQENIRTALPKLSNHFPLPDAVNYYNKLLEYIGTVASQDLDQIPKDPAKRQRWVSYAERDLRAADEFLRQQSQATPATENDLARLLGHFAQRS